MTTYDVYHGTGNDFAVVDAADASDPDALGVALCEALGVDGALFVDVAATERERGRRETASGEGRPASDGQDTTPDGERGRRETASDAETDDGVRATMTLVQPDGSRAAMCGNGARCAARWVAERTGASVVTLETGAGPRRCTVDGETVTVEMGVPSFAPDDVSHAREGELVEADLAGWTVTALNTGVPHAVVFVDDVDSVDLDAMAPALRHHDVFPEGANVNLAAEDDGGFAQRTFERGVEGETEACGTGAVAIAVAAARLGMAPETGTVTVSPPGGDLEIGLRADGATTLRGPTTYVESGETEATLGEHDADVGAADE
ncbi:diaminopimelate epimerase [Halarchaeum sp. CBA1220]|uniref:diaminopimelate epimerase n=1 Tax=Halarchaeum sp. CBA1220 TaxID=1853682 RepID=UPI000F3A9ED5|nr:diaminopimelate epimerase [Halarchaeum sp. CBA1220]QLC33879.1 diaminopimelate epimerase [Halarchaeum sp. CBA1220]